MGNTLFTIIENNDIENIISSCGTTAFSVFVFLKMMQGKNGKCWPSVSYLCNKMKLSKNTVLNSVKKLEKMGFVAVVHNKNVSNSYSISAGSKIEPVVQNLNPRGSKIEPGGSKIEPPGVQKLNLNNIYNNIQKENSINNIHHDFSILSQPYQILSKFSDWQPEIISALQKKEKFILGYLEIIDKILKFDSITTELIFRAKSNIDSNPFYQDKPHLKTIEWLFKFDKNGQGAAAHIRKIANNPPVKSKSRYQKI